MNIIFRIRLFCFPTFEQNFMKWKLNIVGWSSRLWKDDFLSANSTPKPSARAIAGMLLFQDWIIILMGIPIIPLTYIDLIRADKDAIEKFGDDYKTYMKKVPRANFLIGILRRLDE